MTKSIRIGLVCLAALFVTDMRAGNGVAPAEADESLQPYSEFGADSCLTCHADQQTAMLFGSSHGRRDQRAGPFGPEQLQCEACHGPGGVHARRLAKGQSRAAVVGFGVASKTPVATQNAMCSGCHGPAIHRDWSGSSHARADVPCAACHRSHTRTDPVLARATQPEVCFACHAAERHASQLPYAHPIRQGKMSCTDCHGPHGGAGEFELRHFTINDTCNSCHADKRGPFLWEHAPVVERCTLCHQAHGAVQSSLLVQRAPWLCQQCHAEAGHPSIALGPGSIAGAQPSPYLLGGSCLNCHSQVHGSNHPSGSKLTR